LKHSTVPGHPAKLKKRFPALKNLNKKSPAEIAGDFSFTNGAA
jgi:hypothetical protein